MSVPLIILSIMVAAGFVALGIPKVLADVRSAAMGRHLGLSPTQYRCVGLFDLAGAGGLVVGLFWAPLGIVAALGLCGMMVGAAALHLRAKDPITIVIPACAVGVTAAAIAALHIASP